jgi:hypothetical protein
MAESIQNVLLMNRTVQVLSKLRQTILTAETVAWQNFDLVESMGEHELFATLSSSVPGSKFSPAPRMADFR